MTYNLSKNLNKEKHLELIQYHDWIWKDETIGHVELTIGGTKISFWLGSGKWYIQSLNKKGTGFYQLLEFLGQVPKKEEKEEKEDKDQIITELRAEIARLTQALSQYEDKPVEDYFV
nr:MAG TPA: hypothetical protein [Caudoviricetes sp.]